MFFLRLCVHAGMLLAHRSVVVTVVPGAFVCYTFVYLHK